MTTTSESDRSAPSILRPAAAFAAAFLLTATLIHAAIPSPLYLYANMRSEKLTLLDQWHTRVASALFGASHMHNGFDPRTFDQTLAATPFHTTTLNLAVEGGAQSEERAMALNYLKHVQPHPDQACFVMLELNAGANLTNEHLIHPRSINLYDWDTLRFIHTLAPTNLGIARSEGRMAFAVAATGMYYANVGMLSSFLFPPTPDNDIIEGQTKNDRRGYLTPPFVSGADAHVAAQIAALPHTMLPDPQTLLPGNYNLIADLQHASPLHNLHFVYVVTPHTDNLKSFPQYPASMIVNGQEVPILSIDNPNLYPDLYNPKNWHDDAHLSESGAALFGKYLGTQLARYYASHPQPMSCAN